MNKNTKWFLALGVAAMIGTNGLAMTAGASEKQTAPDGKRPADKSEFRHKREHKVDNTALLTILKIDEETFRAERKTGKSLVVIAKEHGVSEQELQEFMLQQMTQRMEASIKAGKITAEQAEKMKADMEKRVTGMINGEGAMHRSMHGPMDKGPMHEKRRFDNSQMLKLLNIDEETFRTEMRAGKSLAVIAKEHGVSEQALKETMLNQMDQRLEADVKAGRLTAEEAATRKADMEKRIDTMINGKGPMHKR